MADLGDAELKEACERNAGQSTEGKILFILNLRFKPL